MNKFKETLQTKFLRAQYQLPQEVVEKNLVEKADTYIKMSIAHAVAEKALERLEVVKTVDDGGVINYNVDAVVFNQKDFLEFMLYLIQLEGSERYEVEQLISKLFLQIQK